MSLISSAELGAIQALAQSGMTGTCVILTRSTIETADGQESVWATVGDEVVCWVRQITGDAKTLGAISGAVGISQLFNIRMPIGTVVLSGDRIGMTGVIYDVQSTNVNDSYPAWVEAACRTIE